MKRYSMALLAITILVSLASCTEGDDVFDPRNLSVSIQPTEGQLPADGTSSTDIEVQVTGPVGPADMVTLTTSAGTLLSAGGSGTTLMSPLDASGAATVRLMSSTTIGTAFVGATLDDEFAQTEVEFVVASPSSLTVDAGTFQLEAGLDKSAMVAVQVSRPVGQGAVSSGLLIEYFAVDDQGSPLGEFRGETLTDAMGKSVATYSAGDTTFRGTATITARYSDPVTAEVIEDSAGIEIVDPEE